MKDVDVVVVGAGSAGLAAAKTLRAAGLSFTVLEAMNRVGGRAWTSTEHFGIPFDIGCAWIHAADRNPYFAEAEAAGWTLHHHDMNVDHLYYGKGRYRFESGLDLRRLASEMGDGYVVGFRGHSNVVDTISTMIPGVRDLSSYPDMRDLILSADVLLTDYSTAMFDFALTGRPMVFYPYDLIAYRDWTRGFYFDYEETVPGPIITDPNDLGPAIAESASRSRSWVWTGDICVGSPGN
jgi:choline dehydrogenase-like flavoprotein